jgi:hypothetical protein
MSATKNGALSDERDEGDQPQTVGLVWRKVSPWVIETNNGRYRIEKFAVGNIFRYRILKILNEWYFELAPTETTAEAAKEICQQDLTRGSASTQK